MKHDLELRRYIMSLLPHGQDAEEVLQRSATVIWERFADYDPDRSFLPWAYKVTYFEILNYRKERARSRLVFSDDVLAALAESRDEQVEELNLQQAALKQCLKKLDLADASLLWRRYADSASIAELAQDQGRTAKSLYRRLDRIREQIALCVKRRIKSFDLEGELRV